MAGFNMRARWTGIVPLVALLVVTSLLGGCGLTARTESSSEQQDVYRGVTGAVPGDGAITQENQGAPDANFSKPAPVPPGSGEDASTVPADRRLVIRMVDMRVEVDDVEESVAAIRKAVEDRKGIVTDLQVSTDEDVPIYRPYVEGSSAIDGAPLSGYVTVRVPADTLEAFIAETGKLGNVVRQAENESDVTQQHIDLAARLKNLQASEAQLRDFFGKAKNVTEMLTIQQELTRVRGEIEAMQAEMAYLERQAAMSTVTVELIGPAPVVRPQGENWGFRDALTRSVRSFVSTVNAIIVFAGAIAPIALIALIVFFIAHATVRKRRTIRPAVEQGDESER
ncbi:MAG: hypothetical protein CVT60_04815 [Actinobacteria bacterium HGW-Actinobacteria-10]|jgi:hypothetical protein|nr:MAG: hypothetical protein CVT60_04815 [Actinobacteria bacterium HGW-Actinobacteria-10]